MESVYLGRQALITLIVSSVEVYKKETYGILVGSRQRNNWKISQAINFQSAKRDYTGIEMNISRIKRINATVKYLSNKKYIGDFHSHSDAVEGLSRHDKKEILKDKDTISLLVNVDKPLRTTVKKWRYNRKKRMLYGPLGDKLIVRISIFGVRYIKNRAKIEKHHIKCPYIKNLNKIVKYYKKMKKELRELEKDKRYFEKRRKNIKRKLVKL